MRLEPHDPGGSGAALRCGVPRGISHLQRLMNGVILEEKEQIYLIS